jgi:hypothetical protein
MREQFGVETTEPALPKPVLEREVETSVRHRTSLSSSLSLSLSALLLTDDHAFTWIWTQ